ncbi:cytidine deaminase-like protein [Whalleya microplaca]|nr:cytidine deaminase-like protein [Whalleya microplaca]
MSPSEEPLHDPVTLLSALLSTIETQIVPLTTSGVSSGSKLFGAAILLKSDLTPITVATNNEQASPLLHGEINCIQSFFSSPTITTTTDSPSPRLRPSPRDCIFVATHEPCSLCLSGIVWSGFDNFYHLFTHGDSADRFGIPYDLQILREVFRVRAEGESGEALERRALYNRRNAFFTARSFAELVAEIADEGERARWEAEVERVKRLYDGLSGTYQEGKREGVESASVWK